MKNTHQYWVYLLSNTHNTVLYIGVSNNLERRVVEHKSGLVDGFSKKYNCNKLVYFEGFGQIEEAIAREKQLKNWKREWKNALIEKENPLWNDLSADWESAHRQEIAGQARNDNTP